MPRIFDNIELPLLPILRETLKLSNRADFCIGYFNLRGWQKIDSPVEQYTGGEWTCCGLLLGMQRLPEDEIHAAFKLGTGNQGFDNIAILRFTKRMAAEFRKHFIIGAPTNQNEAGLQRLSTQIKAKKLIIKLLLRHPLHAKLYLIHRDDSGTSIMEFSDSSSFTILGLAKQGELNVNVLNHNACNKLFYKCRFKCLRSALFNIKNLKQELLANADTLDSTLQKSRVWNSQQDEKPAALTKLLQFVESFLQAMRRLLRIAPEVSRARVQS